MKKVGIIAEFNIFHNGHQALLNYAKNDLKADAVIIAMSGEFTQRGQMALLNKYTRANMALNAGAGLVFEIPTIFATASAEDYAMAGISLLNAAGIDTLLFGSECGQIEPLSELADYLLNVENDEILNNKIKSLLKSGLTYPAALSKALAETKTDTNILKSNASNIISDLLSKPNNILAIEYIKAIKRSGLNIKPVTIKRTGQEYNDESLSDNHCLDSMSASAIRNFIFKNPALDDYSMLTIPDFVSDAVTNAAKDREFIFTDDISLLMHEKLLEITKASGDFQINSANKIYDLSQDLYNKIINNAASYISYTAFCDNLKSKNLTYSHISRSLCRILLEINNDIVSDIKSSNYLPYLRLLGFKAESAGLLHEIKANSDVMLITKLSDLNQINSINETNKSSLSYDSCENKKETADYSSAISCLNIDLHAYNIRRMILTNRNHKAYPNEASLKFLVKQ